MSSRRAVLAGSLASVALSSVAGRAQPAAGGPTIGFLTPASGVYIGTPTAVFDSFRRGLADLGYVEGQNIRYEYRSAPDRAGLGKMAAELVRLKVDVLVATSVAAVIAKPFSANTPMVFGFSGDPVQAGLVNSLARPGGNVTGMSFLATELVGKRLTLLKEAAPAISRVAVLGASAHPGERSEWRAWEDTGRTLGVSLELFELKKVTDLDAALTAVASSNINAIHAFPDGVTAATRVRIAEFALSHHLPTVFGWKAYVEAGGLMSYGPNLEDSWRVIAGFVDKILKGSRPADLPVELPTRFELIINQKTARALGLTMPSIILASADEIIE
ncbi:MAG TPA: ABC transporter substrate-binding protein [Stellaceae bacterium]|nr:ABC transporter substrate-binding protein [Stellaceae bacterium]